MADIQPSALYGALSTLEGKLNAFLSEIDVPLEPMGRVIADTQKLADQASGGAPVRGGEIGQIMSGTSAVSVAFDKVWKLFQAARDAGYAVASVLGVKPPTGKSRSKKPPTDYSNVPDTDLVKGIADLTPKFEAVIDTVRKGGQALVGEVKQILNAIDAEKTDGVQEATNLLKPFVDFRDSVSGYYSIMGSLSRRVNQLLVNVGHSKIDTAGGEPVSEMILIPWGDEFGDYEEEQTMTEDKKKTKKESAEKAPEGAIGNMPAPSSAPPVGVENKVALPPMMHVERLVRSLKNQIIEGLK